MKRGMSLTKETTRKVERLTAIFKAETGFDLSRSQVVNSLLDREIAARETGAQK